MGALAFTNFSSPDFKGRDRADTVPKYKTEPRLSHPHAIRKSETTVFEN